MRNQNGITESSLHNKMEDIWEKTCGSWQNCNETTIQSFLSLCLEHNLDPQFCMSWVEQNKDKIPNWSAVSDISLEWVNQHTSTGSAISYTNQDMR